MSNESQLPPVRMVLEISSGVIVQASSDRPVDLIVLDHDLTDDVKVSICGDEVCFYRVGVTPDDDVVQAIYREVEAVEDNDDEDGV